MTAEQIRELLRATPFVPFRVHVAAEPKAYDVPHPEFALLTHGGPGCSWLLIKMQTRFMWSRCR